MGTLRIVATITPAEVIRKFLHHLKRSAGPPPAALARPCQDTFAWVATCYIERVA